MEKTGRTEEDISHCPEPRPLPSLFSINMSVILSVLSLLSLPIYSNALRGVFRDESPAPDKCPWVPECHDESDRCRYLALDGQCFGIVPNDTEAAAMGKFKLDAGLAMDVNLVWRRTCRIYGDIMGARMSKLMLQVS